MAGVLALSVVTGFLVFRGASGQRPFRQLASDEIAEVSVTLEPPGKTVSLDRAAIEELAGILRVVTVYARDDSWSDYCGQSVLFTITETDGTVVTVQACNPFFVLDGTGYRTKYEPCEALSQLANEQLS